jgi:hypothetical protein
MGHLQPIQHNSSQMKEKMQILAFKNENNSGHQQMHWDLKARQYRLTKLPIYSSTE